MTTIYFIFTLHDEKITSKDLQDADGQISHACQVPGDAIHLTYKLNILYSFYLVKDIHQYLIGAYAPNPLTGATFVAHS